MKLIGIVGIICLTLASTTWAESVYRWVDENGEIHFSDRAATVWPVDEVEVGQINTFTAPPVTERVDTEDNTPKDTNKHVVIYSTAWCNVCKAAKAYMNAKGITYTEYDIEKSTSAQQRFRELGGVGVPLIIVGQYRMSGFSGAKLDAMLAAAN